MKQLSILVLFLSGHLCFSMHKKYQQLSVYENDKKEQTSEKIIEGEPTYIIKNALDKQVKVVFYRNDVFKTMIGVNSRNIISFHTHYPKDSAKIEIFSHSARDPECIGTLRL